MKKIFLLIVVFILFILCGFFYFKYKQVIFDNLGKIELKNSFEIDRYNKKIKQKNSFLKSFDFDTDSSITKFVSAKISFNNINYVPKNLVNISTGYIVDGKGGNQKLRKEALIALKKMAEAYYRETGEKIIVVSAYRSYLYQKAIKDRGCPDNLCAKAGFSEHQTGLTIDLWAASSLKNWQKEPFISRYKWLKENAYKYGFHNSYQKGIEIDTYDIEPWHWRYLGEPLAKYLWERNLTFAELYNKMEQH